MSDESLAARVSEIKGHAYSPDTSYAWVNRAAADINELVGYIEDMLPKMRGFCLVHDADCDSCPCCEAVHADDQRRAAELLVVALREVLEDYSRIFKRISAQP